MISSKLANHFRPSLDKVLKQSSRLASHQHRLASTLVLSEPLLKSSDSTKSIPPSTLSTITAATQLHDGPITLLLITDESESPHFSDLPEHVDSIHVCKTGTSANLAETIAEVIFQKVEEGGEELSHVVATHSKFGSSFLPRASALCRVSPVTDVITILESDTFVRPMYAGNALAKVKSKNTDLQLLTFRPSAFDKCNTLPNDSSIPITESTLSESGSKALQHISWKSENVSKSDRPDLGSASVVISGGRGMQNGENFALLTTLADKVGGAVGASRAAVDAGFVPNDWQVGQTGKVVAPDLYMAVGISGAIQHLSGMKDSKTIVAINTDPEAPIFQVADYGLSQDLFDAVPELTEKI